MEEEELKIFEEMSGDMKSKIERKFKEQNYSLDQAVLKEVFSFLKENEEDEDRTLNKLLVVLKNVNLLSRLLSKVKFAIYKLKKQDGIFVIDYTLVPKIIWNGKIFNEVSIKGDVDAKSLLYTTRYALCYEYQIYTQEKDHQYEDHIELLAERGDMPPKLCNIHLLKDNERSRVVGCISRSKDGRIYLRDKFDSIEIRISNPITTLGYFPETAIVVAEGRRSNSVFEVERIGHPPSEDRQKSLSFMHPRLDFFGGGVDSPEDNNICEEMEKIEAHQKWVIFSDIWLDNKETIGKLQTVFDGYEKAGWAPNLIVMMGNFSSNNSFSMRSDFAELGEMIGKHPLLKKKSEFLFIPGPDDPGSLNALPRCALPDFITEELRNVIPKARFGCNPCRIKLYTK